MTAMAHQYQGYLFKGQQYKDCWTTMAMTILRTIFLGPSIAMLFKEPILKELLAWYGYDIVEDYLPVAKKPIPKVIFKSPIAIKGCVLGLANVET
nr:hypothetical protein [Tanacetum cinerariifolium]